MSQLTVIALAAIALTKCSEAIALIAYALLEFVAGIASAFKKIVLPGLAIALVIIVMRYYNYSLMAEFFKLMQLIKPGS